MYQECLAIREKALGPEHPEVASSQYNIGLVFRLQVRVAEIAFVGVPYLFPQWDDHLVVGLYESVVTPSSKRVTVGGNNSTICFRNVNIIANKT